MLRCQLCVALIGLLAALAFGCGGEVVGSEQSGGDAGAAGDGQFPGEKKDGGDAGVTPPNDGGGDGAVPADAGHKDGGHHGDGGGGDSGETEDSGTTEDGGDGGTGTDTGTVDAGGCRAGNEPCVTRDDCCGGLVCPAGTCQPSVCGDGYVDEGRLEECDDKNGISGDGCENNCKFTCLSTDPTRDCRSTNPCENDGACDDAVTHVCSPGNDKADGTVCGTGMICLAGACGATACGDGYVDANAAEQCDLGPGKNVAGSGCEPNCTFTCADPAADCAPAACKKNTCTAAHVCKTDPDPSLNGTVCGNGLICNNGSCEAPPQVCGNGKKEGTEECDDGNVTPGDGCEPVTCTYTCHNPAADCPPPPVCNAALCIDVVSGGGKVGQRCATQPASEGQSPPGCGAPNTCKNGTCTPPAVVCGNGAVESGEDCDYGPGLNTAGSGCEPNCKFSCAKAPDSCPDNNPCNGTEVCTTVTVNGHTGQKCFAGTPPGDGTACGTGNICLGGQCVQSTCGDGFTDAGGGEQCDFGQGFNTTGSGCEPNCKFSCGKAPDSCPDNNPCNGTEVCTTVTVNGHPGQKCNAGTPLKVGDSCGAGNLICTGNPLTCGASRCGDGYVDTGAGEQCEPPNTPTCDAACKTIVAAKCGDNILAASEQCDDADGTPNNLDGCDTACKYEMMLRMNSIAISTKAAPAGCTPTTNWFGTHVLSSTAVGQLNPSLQSGVDDGSTNVIMQMLGINDLTGVNDPSMQIGIMTGILDPAKGAWPGNNPIDWWFLISPITLDPNDLPSSRFTTASINARAITAGPNDVTMALLMGGSPANLMMRDAHLFATVDNPPAPNVPAPPPSLLQSGVTVMQSINATASGKGLCGNITVDSLAKIPIPQVLTTGTSACGSCSGSKTYTYCGAGQPVGPSCNSMLDAIVGGCKVMLCLVTVITASQPDVLTGSGAAPLTLGAGNKVPDSQSSGNMHAYSSFLNFTANRAHATGKSP